MGMVKVGRHLGGDETADDPPEQPVLSARWAAAAAASIAEQAEQQLAASKARQEPSGAAPSNFAGWPGGSSSSSAGHDVIINVKVYGVTDFMQLPFDLHLLADTRVVVGEQGLPHGSWEYRQSGRYTQEPEFTIKWNQNPDADGTIIWTHTYRMLPGIPSGVYGLTTRNVKRNAILLVMPPGTPWCLPL